MKFILTIAFIAAVLFFNSCDTDADKKKMFTSLDSLLLKAKDFRKTVDSQSIAISNHVKLLNKQVREVNKQYDEIDKNAERCLEIERKIKKYANDSDTADFKRDKMEER